MLTLSEHFDILRSRIEPTEERSEAAKDIPTAVRDYLKQSEELVTVDPHSRLAGSYARNTAIKDIKDVDVIILVDPDYFDEAPVVVLDVLFKVLRGLPEALDDAGEVVSRRHQQRSINVHLEHQDFDLDIVPAVASKGLSNSLKIPDKDWDKWIDTHPLGYGSKLSKLNSKHGEKVVPIIKLLKHWRDVHIKQRRRRPKSYWLECMVYHCIDEGKVSTERASYAELFTNLLASIYEDFLPDLEKKDGLPIILDPLLGHNIVHKWDRSAFEMFMGQIGTSLRWAQRALAKDEGAEEEAIELWQKVFGEEWFPDSVQVQAEQLRAATEAGSVYVGSTGKIYTDKPQEPYVQSTPQRFYGPE
jgi:hypothetical protein